MEIARGHLQPGAFHGAAEAEQRHHDAETELAIEIGAADAHAVIGENVGSAIGAAVALRPSRTIEKSEVPPPISAIRAISSARYLPLIVQRRCDRLELECDLVEADLARNLTQGLLGLGVGVRVVVDEVHGAAMHHLAQFAPCGLFGAPFHRAQIIADHVAKPGALAAHPGGLIDQRGAEHRLQAAHQAAVHAVDIGFDGLAADQHSPVRLVEDRARNRGVADFQRRQDRGMIFDGAERRVRCSEIKSADRHGHSRRSARLHNIMPPIHRYLCAMQASLFGQTESRRQANVVRPQNNLFDTAG